MTADLDALRWAQPIARSRLHIADAPTHVIDQARAAVIEAQTRNRNLDQSMTDDFPDDVRHDDPTDPTSVVHQLLIRHTARLSDEPRLVCSHDHIIEPSFTWNGQHVVIACTRPRCVTAAAAVMTADYARHDYCSLCGPVTPGEATRYVEVGLGLGRMTSMLCRRHDLGPKLNDTPRNAPCPCGSGRKYKHCHGTTK